MGRLYEEKISPMIQPTREIPTQDTSVSGGTALASIAPTAVIEGGKINAKMNSNALKQSGVFSKPEFTYNASGVKNTVDMQPLFQPDPNATGPGWFRGKGWDTQINPDALGKEIPEYAAEKYGFSKGDVWTNENAAKVLDKSGLESEKMIENITDINVKDMYAVEALNQTQAMLTDPMMSGLMGWQAPLQGAAQTATQTGFNQIMANIAPQVGGAATAIPGATAGAIANPAATKATEAMFGEIMASIGQPVASTAAGTTAGATAGGAAGGAASWLGPVGWTVLGLSLLGGSDVIGGDFGKWLKKLF